jgi:hypothetical protein
MAIAYLVLVTLTATTRYEKRSATALHATASQVVFVGFPWAVVYLSLAVPNGTMPLESVARHPAAIHESVIFIRLLTAPSRTSAVRKASAADAEEGAATKRQPFFLDRRFHRTAQA